MESGETEKKLFRTHHNGYDRETALYSSISTIVERKERRNIEIQKKSRGRNSEG